MSLGVCHFSRIIDGECINVAFFYIISRLGSHFKSLDQFLSKTDDYKAIWYFRLSSSLIIDDNNIYCP